MKRMKLLAVAALALVICLPVAAGAGLITNTSSFTPGYQVESFEGVTPDLNKTGLTNTGPVTRDNYFAVGTTGAYTFASGVTLSAPYPAGTFDQGGPYIHDFSIQAINNGGNEDYWASNGSIGNLNQMPAGFGAAYIGVFRIDNTHFTFTFPTDVVRAGVYLSGWPCDDNYKYTLQAMDSGGNVLASYLVNSATIANWGSNFVGIELPGGFSSLDIMGSGQQWIANNAAVDMLTFQSVPLPPSVLLMGTGILGLVGLGWRRRKVS